MENYMFIPLRCNRWDKEDSIWREAMVKENNDLQSILSNENMFEI